MATIEKRLKKKKHRQVEEGLKQKQIYLVMNFAKEVEKVVRQLTHRDKDALELGRSTVKHGKQSARELWHKN